MLRDFAGYTQMFIVNGVAAQFKKWDIAWNWGLNLRHWIPTSSLLKNFHWQKKKIYRIYLYKRPGGDAFFKGGGGGGGGQCDYLFINLY